MEYTSLDAGDVGDVGDGDAHDDCAHNTTTRRRSRGVSFTII